MTINSDDSYLLSVSSLFGILKKKTTDQSPVFIELSYSLLTSFCELLVGNGLQRIHAGVDLCGGFCSSAAKT